MAPVTLKRLRVGENGPLFFRGDSPRGKLETESRGGCWEVLRHFLKGGTPS